jgi:hypothetical protein
MSRWVDAAPKQEVALSGTQTLCVQQLETNANQTLAS